MARDDSSFHTGLPRLEQISEIGDDIRFDGDYSYIFRRIIENAVGFHRRWHCLLSRGDAAHSTFRGPRTGLRGGAICL